MLEHFGAVLPYLSADSTARILTQCHADDLLKSALKTHRSEERFVFVKPLAFDSNSNSTTFHILRLCSTTDCPIVA